MRRNSVSIVGAAETTDLGKIPGLSQIQLHADAALNAIADAGLKLSDIDGIATALTFHRAVVSDPAFAPADPATPFSVHTRWIETEFNNTIPAFSGTAGELAEESAQTKEARMRRHEAEVLARYAQDTAVMLEKKVAEMELRHKE